MSSGVRPRISQDIDRPAGQIEIAPAGRGGAVATANAFDSSMSASDIPHLHEQDATCAGRITSAVRLGGTRSFEQVRCDA